MRYIPKFDPNYNPAYIALNEFYKTSTHTIKVAVERENGLIYVKEIPVNDDLNESYYDEGKQYNEILLSGNERKIAEWEHEVALERTERLRPDLLDWFIQKARRLADTKKKDIRPQ